MTARCTNKGFYVQGIKIYSHEATYDSDKGPLKVVVAAEAGVGEISVKDLPDEITLRFTGHQDMQLQFVRETMHGRLGRGLFDPHKIPDVHRDSYISLGLKSMAMGAKESEQYAHTVLRAAVSFPGKKTNEILTSRCDNFLNPTSQQYDEILGAKMLATVIDLSHGGQEVSPEWIKERLDNLTHWHGMAILLTPGTLSQEADDFLLDKVLIKIREQNPGALAELKDDAGKMRNETDRTNLRNALVTYMAARPTIDNLMDGTHGEEMHVNFFAKILVQSRQTAPESCEDDLLKAAKAEVTALVAANSVAVLVPRPTGGKKINAHKKQKREKLTLRELRDNKLTLTVDIRRLEQDRMESDGHVTKEAKAHLDALRDKLNKVTAKIDDIQERRYVKAETYLHRDKVFLEKPREHGQAPEVPSMVRRTLEDLKELHAGAVMDTLLNMLPDGRLEYPHKNSDTGTHRLELAKALNREMATARDPDDSGRRPGLFNNRTGISPYSDVPWKWFDAEINQGPTQKRVKSPANDNPLHVRAKLLHSALFPADDRLMASIETFSEKRNKTFKQGLLNEREAEIIVENMETALYTLIGLSAMWEGLMPDSERHERELSRNFEDERSLMLTENTRRLLSDMRNGLLKLGTDPVRTSYSCLAALKEVGWQWPKLRAQVLQALDDPAVKKNKEKTKEHQTSLPAELPKNAAKYLRNLPRDPRIRTTPSKQKDKKPALWILLDARPKPGREGILEFFGAGGTNAGRAEQNAAKKKNYWEQQNTKRNPKAEGMLALIDNLRQQLAATDKHT